MKQYQLVIIAMVIGLVLLWGCGVQPAADEAQEAASQPTATPQPQEESEVEEAEGGQPDEPASVDESEPTEVPPTATSQPEPEVPPTATSQPTPEPSPTPTDEPTAQPAAEVETPEESTSGSAPADVAHVISVGARGESGSYNFSVEISSPDTGCDQYADWWEVLTEDGELLYRRILAHSHVNEQPFVRSGGPVGIAASEVVLVRAHMNPGGYGGTVFKGSPDTGFAAVDIAPDFAADAANQSPLPTGCAF